LLYSESARPTMHAECECSNKALLSQRQGGKAKRPCASQSDSELFIPTSSGPSNNGVRRCIV
jgi:hypothetical protein